MQKVDSEKELYQKLIPALNTRVYELNRSGINYIKKEDIWNYLKLNYWSKSSNLYLYEMVDDILNIDYCLLDDYIKGCIRNNKTKPIIESGGSNG